MGVVTTFPRKSRIQRLEDIFYCSPIAGAKWAFCREDLAFDWRSNDPQADCVAALLQQCIDAEANFETWRPFICEALKASHQKLQYWTKKHRLPAGRRSVVNGAIIYDIVDLLVCGCYEKAFHQMKVVRTMDIHGNAKLFSDAFEKFGRPTDAIEARALEAVLTGSFCDLFLHGAWLSHLMYEDSADDFVRSCYEGTDELPSWIWRSTDAAKERGFNFGIKAEIPDFEYADEWVRSAAMWTISCRRAIYEWDKR